MGASGARSAAFVIGDGDFFTSFDTTNCMDGFTLRVAVPAMISVWKTTVVDKANGRVDSANHRSRAAGQSIGFDNTAEWVPPVEVIVQGQELSLLSF